MIQKIILILFSTLYSFVSLTAFSAFSHHAKNMDTENMDKAHNTEHHTADNNNHQAHILDSADCSTSYHDWLCEQDSGSCQTGLCCEDIWWCLSHCTINTSVYVNITIKKSYECEHSVASTTITRIASNYDFSLYKHYKTAYSNSISYQESQFPPFRVGIIELLI